jgi:hypothetical protein
MISIIYVNLPSLIFIMVFNVTLEGDFITDTCRVNLQRNALHNVII